MYGSPGPWGPEGPIAPGGVSGDYGVPPLIVGAAIFASTLATTVAVGEGVQAYQAVKEAEGYTGGQIRNHVTGEWEDADVVHSRLCDTLPADHYMKIKDKNGVIGCDRSPSEEGAYWADNPDGFTQALQETFGGYQHRKEKSGDCDAKGADGRPLDPRCNQGPESPIKPWMLFAAAGVAAAAILFYPSAKGK